MPGSTTNKTFQPSLVTRNGQANHAQTRQLCLFGPTPPGVSIHRFVRFAIDKSQKLPAPRPRLPPPPPAPASPPTLIEVASPPSPCAMPPPGTWPGRRRPPPRPAALRRAASPLAHTPPPTAGRFLPPPSLLGPVAMEPFTAAAATPSNPRS